MNDLASRLRAELVSTLRAQGTVRSDRWVEAFLTVPRHEFLTEFFTSDDGITYAAVGADDGERWLRLAYTDEAWVTQIDNDSRAWARARAGEPVTGAPTSSSSTPGLMAEMLEALDVTDDSRVLELGTGTGYNAALLCAGLSDRQVASVDIDPDLVRRSAEALARVGYRPLLHAADGDALTPPADRPPYDRSPYDRLIVTYGVPRVPPRWLSLVEPAGLIVAPLSRDQPIGAMVRLAVTDDRRAEGRFLPFYGAFMPSRRRAGGDLSSALAGYERGEGTARESTMSELSLGHTEPWQFFAAVMLGDLTSVDVLDDYGAGQEPGRVRHLLVSADGSWACQQGGSEGPATVWEGGPRRLWAELEAAHDQWRRLGEPQRERFGLTVALDREELWIDHPEHVLRTSAAT